MTTQSDALTKLTRFDRALLSSLGLIIVIGLGALLNAPLLWTAAAAGLYVTGLQAYGRIPRERDLADPNLKTDSSDMGLFDQRAIADNLSEAVWIINSREQIIYANKAAAGLFGQTSPGRRLATVLRQPVVTQMVKTVLQGGNAEPVDYHASTPVDRHLRVTASPIDVDRGDESSRRFAMLVFYDVTDFVKFAATQGDFLANASHELKTPIASLLGYIETLRGHAKNDPEAREKFLVIMQEQVQRMQRLINDLLSLRQIEVSEHIAPSAAADIKAAAKFAIDTVSPLAKARGVKVSIDGPKSLIVKGHQDELIQLCLNIVDNAVKMTPSGGAVSLHLSQIETWRAQDFISVEKNPNSSSRQIVTPPPAPQGYGVVRFSDSGPGFSREHIPRLGERFYRIIGDRNSHDKGTGLGLAIVKHLVVRHRGGLLVNSLRRADMQEAQSDDLVTGTTFTLILPLKD